MLNRRARLASPQDLVLVSLLCIYVSNSETTLGLFDGTDLSAHWRVATVERRTADEWGVLFESLLGGRTEPSRVDGICLCSTVPAVLPEMRQMIARYFPTAPTVVVGAGVRTGLPVLVDNPREVGTDRIANALAALDLYGAPCIVVSFGLATTFDVVNENGEYVGGAIAPGAEVSLAALGDQGAQLRRVELVRPGSVIAKNTVEAMQSGAIYGLAGQVDGIVRRMRAELGVAESVLEVVAAGGFAERVLGDCDTVTRHEPHLTLHGLRLIFVRNQRR